MFQVMQWRAAEEELATRIHTYTHPIHMCALTWTHTHKHRDWSWSNTNEESEIWIDNEGRWAARKQTAATISRGQMRSRDPHRYHVTHVSWAPSYCPALIIIVTSVTGKRRSSVTKSKITLWSPQSFTNLKQKKFKRVKRRWHFLNQKIRDTHLHCRTDPEIQNSTQPAYDTYFTK